jgi:hypothetical protein
MEEEKNLYEDFYVFIEAFAKKKNVSCDDAYQIFLTILKPHFMKWAEKLKEDILLQRDGPDFKHQFMTILEDPGSRDILLRTWKDLGKI